ncbi:MAG: hypothetical protein WC734_02630 [Patescibacteria group bacterium]|jgi:hypothetical protein
MMIPEGFVDWLAEFTEKRLLFRVVWNPSQLEAGTWEPSRLVEVVTRWNAGDQPWVVFIFGEHLGGQGSHLEHTVGKLWRNEDLTRLVQSWDKAGLCEQYSVQRQTVACVRAKSGVLEVAPRHPKVIAAMLELRGYLWALTANHQPDDDGIRVIRERLGGMLTDLFRNIETVWPLTTEDVGR